MLLTGGQHLVTDLTVQQARKILEAFSCTQGKVLESETEKQQVRQALLFLTSLSDYQTLGICADSEAQALEALHSYLKALGYMKMVEAEASPNAKDGVYLKFNTQRQSLYWDAYSGEYRGVLVTCQMNTPSDLGGTYGHFPLNLFQD
jgi:predicted ATP-grasp superfamily ATP-dependent carboligase